MATRKKKKNKESFSLPMLIICLAVCIAGAISFHFSSEQVPQTIDDNAVPQTAADDATVRYELPQIIDNRNQQIIEHLAYTVSYNHDMHIPNWVAYELTDIELTGGESRKDKFLPDPLVSGDPVVTSDYSRSGYDRGHMAPAGDMKWSEQAMRESFYMTNICPQNHNNNAGDWKDLEELARDLAHRYKSLYICCGPVVTDASKTIGTSRKIVVPQAFYKVFLRRKSDGSWTSIGFLMPNAAGNRPLMTYMRSVDELEQLTGIDFFCHLPDSVEENIEADYTISDWTTQ